MHPTERDGHPHEHLARDAACFAVLEAGAAGETCGVWESPRPAVVVGRFGNIAREVDERACRNDRVPIIRRISGGGAVVVGPGCLNYSFVLSLDRRPELRGADASYDVILGWVADALGIAGVRRAGASDLTIGDRKIGGSAQRRGRRALLHHGTILYAFDTTLMERYLQIPPRQPVYRANRPHRGFVTNVPIELSLVRRALTSCVSA